MPSVNLSNSTLPSVVAQSGRMARTSRKADACESEWLYDKDKFRIRLDERGVLFCGDICSNEQLQ